MSKEIKTTTERYGSSLLDNLIITHEQVLELITEEKLTELGEMASEGCTLHEMSVVLGVGFGEFLLARAKSEDFDKFCHLLETVAASKHLASARAGIDSPQDFSAAAYDRVMSALGFTPYVSHVNVATSDGAAEKESSGRVGFDVAGFMGKFEAEVSKPIDITPVEPSSLEPSGPEPDDFNEEDLM